MAVVIEGIDNSGKSTLARLIVKKLNYTLVESEGPPKYSGEINHRVARYSSIPSPVFVRHPLVSQPIYGRLRGEKDDIDPDLLVEFYNQGHLFIYCDPLDRGLSGHVEKSLVDTARHMRHLNTGYPELLSAYREWAIQRAHILYRIGDDISAVTRFVEARMSRG